MEKKEKINTKLSELRSLYLKRNVLFNQLERSLALKDFWHKAFDNGKCKAVLSGKLNNVAGMQIKFDNGKEIFIANITEVPSVIARHHLNGLLKQIKDKYQKESALRQIKELNLFDEKEN